MVGHIHSFESFGTVDGPGIRFVVFLQGCPLRCQYCHNPDTWKSGGEEYTVEDVAQRALRYKNYFGDKGGVTVSGGEPLLQIDFLIELFTLAKEKGIHTCIDTSGITYKPDNAAYIEKLDKLMPLTDLVMLDIKHIDPQKHIELTNQPNDGILAFTKYLDEKNVPVWIRHVVVPTLTDDEKYLFELGFFIGQLGNLKALDVLPYHDMAKPKYEKLGMDYKLKHIPAMEKSAIVDKKAVILDGIKKTRAEMQNA